MGTASLLLVGLVMLFGLVGVLVPGVPGVVLCWAAVVWWALAERTDIAWGVLVGATALLALTQVVKWLLPVRDMRESGVPWRTLAAGGLLGAVGFFVLPLTGAWWASSWAST